MKNRNVCLKYGSGLALALFTAAAHAALPTEATTAITAAGTAVTDAVAAAWVPIGVGIAAFITIKVVKKASNKIG